MKNKNSIQSKFSTTQIYLMICVALVLQITKQLKVNNIFMRLTMTNKQLKIILVDNVVYENDFYEV
jgi:hypothetical protein